ncbi:MAG: ABC transporter permease [Muribaculaceae bacterium]|nr:ABC transporter permease [Muribaculaceae bacterium]
MNLVFKLLRKNTSPSRLAGFLVSNLIGLAIIGAGLQFYLDARSIWQQEDSFLKSDYLAINKVIDASHTLGGASVGFTREEIAELEAQPWVKRVGTFSRASFNVHASLGLDTGGAGQRTMSTAMFFEAVPDDFLDVAEGTFSWEEGQTDVPIIISKDYLALYNFGFAGAAGLPRMSESLISGIPLSLFLSSEDGTRRLQMPGHVAGYSNRFNTILVPRAFLEAMNTRLGAPTAAVSEPARLIVDVSSPGDAAIAPYLAERKWEIAGDKSASSATYLLKVVTGIVIAVGSVITLLSIFILVLSMSLLMEKNRRKLHSLLMLGYRVPVVARPYWRITALTGVAAGVLAFLCVVLLRSRYLGPLESLGARPASLWPTLLLITFLTFVIILLNCLAISRRVTAAWR